MSQDFYWNETGSTFLWCLVAGLLAGLLFLLGYSCGTQKDTSAPKAAGTYSLPPDYLTINGERWTVFNYDFGKIEKLSASNGDTSCSQRVIFYDASRIKAVSEMKTVIWHEVIHAEHCKHEDPLDKIGANWERFTHDLPEHADVYELGMFLPEFIHTNPEFMKWSEDWSTK